MKLYKFITERIDSDGEVTQSTSLITAPSMKSVIEEKGIEFVDETHEVIAIIMAGDIVQQIPDEGYCR